MDFKAKKMTRDKGGILHNIGSIYLVHLTNNRAPKYMTQK